MTKTILLADDAYEALVDVKRPGECFSDLARRVSKREALDLLLDLDVGLDMTEEEADERLRRTHNARDESMEPRHPT
jgi:predicted CopG family antitoxin